MTAGRKLPPSRVCTGGATVAYVRLKPLDVPSVLIELGYLSNKDDEHLLNQREWQNGLADRLANAIEKFAALSSRDIESSVAAGRPPDAKGRIPKLDLP